MQTITAIRRCSLRILFTLIAPLSTAYALPSTPIVFVVQVPTADDVDTSTNFATITNVASQFGNQFAQTSAAPRGGDLALRLVNGQIRYLTREAGFGDTTVSQGVNAIAVRDPHVHWSAGKLIFSMVIGAPTQPNAAQNYVWQLYEITNLANVLQGSVATIVKVPNQPTGYNNFQPSYLSDGSIVFISDRPRNGAAHLYPQSDEYRQVKTNSGVWRLDSSSGTLTLLEHSPSGSFKPFVDSYGRLLFVRWDHLSQDNLSNAANIGISGAFDYASEAANASGAAPAELFPEPINQVAGSVTKGFEINQFFPWMMNQDGTAEETLNHIGRQELRQFVGHSFTDDDASSGGNLIDLNGVSPYRLNTNFIANFSQMVEDPHAPGRYLAVDGSEFLMHSSGQILALNAPPAQNPANMTVQYLTDRATSSVLLNPNNIGHFRDPLPMADGSLVAAYANYAGAESNGGTPTQPLPKYLFRLYTLAPNGGGIYLPQTALTSGITRSVSYFSGANTISYNGVTWELQPVEIATRPAPPVATSPPISTTPEQASFTSAGISVSDMQEFLRLQNLALVVIRNATSRDYADRQQPFNLHVATAGGTQTLGAGGKIYDISHLQFFQADHVRGLGGSATPLPGRRPIARYLNDPQALRFNPPQPGALPGEQPIFPDGSVALFVPAQRAMVWQSMSPQAAAVVRERYWVTFQPGEIRACGGCHGVNATNQAGAGGAANTPAALTSLLNYWKTNGDRIFLNGFEGP
ncbi:MAG: hypothetical protein ABI411_14750 [Tahibacter sp.]